MTNSEDTLTGVAGVAGTINLHLNSDSSIYFLYQLIFSIRVAISKSCQVTVTVN